jgi:hypothetical protein
MDCIEKHSVNDILEIEQIKKLLKTITSIRTQILSPDGSAAKIDDGTAVIYKIVKQNNSSLSVAEDMMNKTKPKK